MNKVELKLIERINNVFIDTKKYITSKENWIYYFANNKDIFQLLINNPSDWKDKVNFEIENIGKGFAKVSIKFEDENDEEITVKGNIILSHFENSIKYSFAKMEGDILSYKIKEKEEELEYYQKRCGEAREEIEKLKEQQK